jgi:hypothetical protein
MMTGRHPLSPRPSKVARRLALLGALGLTAYGEVALADDAAPRARDGVQAIPGRPKPYAYGILIGSNRGGAGQTPLRYAADDARKMATVLRELGRYGPGDMRVMLDPTARDVLAALDAVASQLREHERKNEQAVLVFYYSGHAKANAIHLGGDELEINTLRDRLRALPSTLTLVVLDACQSGAFQRTKGAAPAADFSYNSVARLTTKGIAVMASSNGQELSQESDELRGSFFTHHLVVALRGAGDLDRDGKVTLDEAYRYAYRRTLAATERTAVGAQHVTLETDLSGQGDVPLTFPAEAKSQLELPAALAGQVLVVQRSTGAIAAEIHKVAGAPLRLALASGDYDTTVRVGSAVMSCTVTLVDDRVMALDLGRCSAASAPASTKGAGDDGAGTSETNAPPQTPFRPDDTVPHERSEPRSEFRRYILELGTGGTHSVEDAYVSRLGKFQYGRTSSATQLRLSASILRSFGPHFSLGIEGVLLPSAMYKRPAISSTDNHATTELSAFGVSGLVRGSLPISFARSGSLPVSFRQSGRLELFGQLRLGLASATESITAGGQPAVDKSYEGPLLGGDLGVALYGKYCGGFISGGYDYAWTVKNNLSDRHNVGGSHFLFGVRFQSR